MEYSICVVTKIIPLCSRIDSALPVDEPPQDAMGVSYSNQTRPAYYNDQEVVHPMKLLFVGDTAVGKTSCVEAFAKIPFREDRAYTLSTEWTTRIVSLDETRVKLTMLHGSGLVRARQSLFLSCRNPHGIVIVYNANNWKTFENVKNWMEELREHYGADTPLLLLGSMCDCKYKEVDYGTAKDFADEHNMAFFEVSAKDRTNIELAVMTLVMQIMEKQVYGTLGLQST